MIVRRLKLRNFRNYENAEICLNPGLNVITGQNAQGKTNLLESLVYLSLTRSHRISEDRKLIHEGSDFADIRCEYEDDRIQTIRAVIHPKGKTLMVHGQPVRKSSEFIGLLNVVLFAPDDLRIFNDQPRERRRVLNQEITKVSGKYLLSLNQYQNLLKERNVLLKSAKVDLRYLDILDEQMAREEYRIVLERWKFIRQIQSIMPALYRDISSDDITVNVRYRSCLEDPENVSEAKLLEMHRQSRDKDLENRMTTAGIHREDIVFELEGKNLITLASQGQKRMTMLAFKMAMLRYIQNETGKRPVLLLDDVLSELDLIRQKKLLDMVKAPYQCIITSTVMPEYLNRNEITEFTVADGRITPISGGI